MPDRVHLIITDKDGTVYDIAANLPAGTVTKTAPPVVKPPVVIPPVVIPPVVTPPVVIGAPPVIPANALRVNMLTKQWKGNHDAGTGGTASGTYAYPVTSPDGRTNCLGLTFDADGGGMIYHVLALATGAKQYNKVCYRKREKKTDAGGWAALNQVETDIEITDPVTGIPTDLAMQQSGTSNEGEEITINHHWTPTGIKINPKLRDNNAWHLTENYMTLYPDKSVGYDGVTFNGIFSPIGIVATDQDSTPWEKDTANVQCQYNGVKGSGKHQIYIDVFEIVFWYDPTVQNVKKA